MNKAKIHLILNHPFFATLALGMTYEEDPAIGTAATNGKILKYNPAWLNSLPTKQQAGVLAHECLHKGLLHHTRMGNRNLKKWNIACDYPINELLTKSGFELPPGCLDPKYFGKSAEEIYTLLPGQKDDPNGDPKKGNDPGGFGGVLPAEGDIQQEEAETKMLMVQAVNAAKMAGKLPAHIARLVDELIQPKINWKEVLQRFVTERSNNDYTWSKPNPRYLPLYLPKLEDLTSGDIVLMVDTSGSIDAQLLAEFSAEILEVTSFLRKQLMVIYVDAQVNAVEFAEEGFTLTPKGGGGTDFRPGYDYLIKEDINPCAVIYFTDGYCNSFPEPVDTLWCVYNNKSFTPPFGEVLHL